MINLRHAIVVAATSLMSLAIPTLTAGVASASTFTALIGGTVTNIYNPQGVIPGDVVVGTPITGYLQYETAGAITDYEFTDGAWYNVASLYISLHIGTLNVFGTSTIGEVHVEDRDQFNFNAFSIDSNSYLSSNAPNANGAVVTLIFNDLVAPYTLLSSKMLPASLSEILISQISESLSIIEFQDNPGTCCLVGNNIQFNATLSPTPVPLPAALPLLAAGLGAMGFMGWRKSRKAV